MPPFGVRFGRGGVNPDPPQKIDLTAAPASHGIPMNPWILAARPRTLGAAVVPVLAGAALASGASGFDAGISALVLACAILIQIATNFFNDAIDHAKGADTSERLGPTRVTAAGLLSPRHVMAGGILCLVVAAVVAIPLVARGGLVILSIGLASLLCAWLYTGGPFPLAYLGLGEIFVVLFFGLIAVAGTYYLNALGFSSATLLAGLQIGLHASVLLAVNNLRDIDGDRAAGKRTLAARFGLGFADGNRGTGPDAVRARRRVARFRIFLRSFSPWRTAPGLVAGARLPCRPARPDREPASRPSRCPARRVRLAPFPGFSAVKLWTHPYELVPGPEPFRAATETRRGCLLKVEFDDGAIGHADLHPWTEFGHPALAAHLSSLAGPTPTAMASLALRHARTDAAARRAGVSLFKGLPEVRSHALFTDWTKRSRAEFQQCADAGYTSVKLKCGRPCGRSCGAQRLADVPLRWRLDANALFAGEDFRGWLDLLNPHMRAKIEFLEDPFPYDPAAWSSAALVGNVPLALDWELPDTPPPWPGAALIVLKPSCQDAFTLAADAARAGTDIIVTHSMDHPLGRATALWTAMRLRQRHGDLVRDGGLQAAGLYAADNFSDCLPERGTQVSFPEGTGFGFDELLAELEWQPLSA